MTFDQAQYWIQRHKQLHQDPRSVGNLGASIEANIKGDMLWQRVADRVAKMLPMGSVLDIGCGYGRVARQFIINGHRYTGIDVSPDAIARAETEHPIGKFICADVLRWQPMQRYNIIAAFYVFVHFVDDDAWRSIIEKSLAWLAPEGVMVMADGMVEARRESGQHVVARSLDEYAQIFASRGFRFDEDAHTELVKRLPGVSGTTNVRFVRRA